MKERLREIAEQAGRGQERWNTTAQFESFLEKFAELMIEKFDLILANEYLDCVGENDKKSQSRIDRLRSRVKEYFGVDE